MDSWASNHKTVKRLTTGFREDSKPQGLSLDFSNRFEIWQAPRHRHYRDARATRFSKHPTSRLPGFKRFCVKTSTTYWIQALGAVMGHHFSTCSQFIMPDWHDMINRVSNQNFSIYSLRYFLGKYHSRVRHISLYRYHVTLHWSAAPHHSLWD